MLIARAKFQTAVEVKQLSIICFLFVSLTTSQVRNTSQSEDTPGGDSDMKWTGMLVVSLRGVNFGFWSRLGCSGQNVIIFSRQGLV